MDVITIPAIWNAFSFLNNEVKEFRLGDLLLSIQWSRGQWRIGSAYVSKGGERTWTRFVADDTDSLSLVPDLPDRPLVVRPREPIKILTAEKALFFARIPPRVKLVAGKPPKQKTIVSFPSLVLSSTWFGEPTTGELCYSLMSTLVTKVETRDISKERIIIPLSVRNNSEETLDFQRICVHVEYLSLFSCDKGLWTNGIEVVFRGADLASQITPLPGKPKYDENAALISPPRVTPGADLLRKSFSVIKYYTGF